EDEVDWDAASARAALRSDEAGGTVPASLDVEKVLVEVDLLPHMLTRGPRRTTCQYGPPSPVARTLTDGGPRTRPGAHVASASQRSSSSAAWVSLPGRRCPSWSIVMVIEEWPM